MGVVKTVPGVLCLWNLHGQIEGVEMRQVLLYPGEDGYWVVECPSLPGCVSQGESREQAILNIREAITLYIEALEDDGLPVPEERFESVLMVV